MKKYIAIIFVTIISIINVDAQSYNKDVIINKTSYTISSKTNLNGEISFELYKTTEPSIKKEFKLQRLNEEILFKLMAFYVKELSDEDVSNDNNFKTEVRNLFYAIAINKLIEKDDDEQPIAGILKIKDTIKIQNFTQENNKKRKTCKYEKNKYRKYNILLDEFFNTNSDLTKKYLENNIDTAFCRFMHEYFKSYNKGNINVNEVEIEFRDSYIETIKVNAIDEFSKSEYRFENKFGIGISSRNAISNFKNIYLFDNRNDFKIKLSDLLDYDYGVQLLTRDFSPSDTVIKSFGGQKLVLKKEKTSKLFEAIVFSDFIGIDKNKPNGLIQTEISKRININPTRIENKTFIKFIGDGYGYFQYLKPSIAISKIEEDNRSITLNTKIDSTTADSITSYKINNYLTPINIFNHQNISLGLDLNVFFFDKPDFKYNLYINGGFRFCRTSVTDSISILNSNNQIQRTGDVNNYGISYFTIYPEVSLHILPEERYGFFITNRWQYFGSAFQNPNLIAYDRNSNIDNSWKSKWINSFELMTYIKTGNNGRLFARWRFNNQLGNQSQNFHQIQVGYSFFVLKKDK